MTLGKRFQIFLMILIAFSLFGMVVLTVQMNSSLDRLSDQSIRQEKNLDILDAWLHQELGRDIPGGP